MPVTGKSVTSNQGSQVRVSKEQCPIQTYAGIPGGIEASFPAMRRMYQDPATEGKSKV